MAGLLEEMFLSRALKPELWGYSVVDGALHLGSCPDSRHGMAFSFANPAVTKGLCPSLCWEGTWV